MATDETTELVPTILDRLAPQDEYRGEIGTRRHGTIEESIGRDLEMLLNTRRESFWCRRDTSRRRLRL